MHYRVGNELIYPRKRTYGDKSFIRKIKVAFVGREKRKVVVRVKPSRERQAC